MSDQRCVYPSCDCDGPEGPACGLPGYAEMMTRPILPVSDPYEFSSARPEEWVTDCDYWDGTS